MNRKKILQIMLAASTFAGGMTMSHKVVDAAMIESASSNNLIGNTIKSINVIKAQVVNVTSNLRVRAAASANSSVLGYLNNKSTIEVLGEEGDWYKINFNGQTAYVSKDYVTLENGTTSGTLTTSSSGQVINVSSELRVRQSPSTSSAIIGSLKNGEKFDIISKSGDWYNIKTGNIIGFISGEYVKEITSTGTTESTSSNSTSTSSIKNGTVINVSSNLRVRTSANATSEVLGYLLNGTKVKVQGEESGWYKIDYNGKTGYVSKEYIQIDGSTTTPVTPVAPTPEEPTTPETPAITSKTGKIINVNSNLNVRSGAGTSSTIIGHLNNGSTVKITGEEAGWYKIDFNGKTGYVSKEYVQINGSTTTPVTPETPAEPVAPTTPETPAITSKTGKIINVNSNLNVRSGAGTSSTIIGHLNNGSTVKVTGEEAGWYKIDFNRKTGYVSKEYVQIDGSTTAPVTPNASNTNQETVKTQKGKVINISSNLRVRTEPNTTSQVLGYLLNGDVIEITSKSSDWYKVNFRGQVGYVSDAYIQIVDSSTSTTTGGTNTGTTTGSTSSAYTTILNAMKEHIGTPYVWGGSGEYLTTSLLDKLTGMYPTQASNGAYTRARAYADKGYRAFDCSGLMQWGFAKAGVKIDRSTWGQILNGVEVPISKIQPGDLLFYSNLTHVGMYIGNGQWIEAPNKSANVRITNVPWGSVTRARRVLN